MIVWWVGNKVVTLASSFMGVQPLDISKRYDKRQKTKVDVPTPATAKSYNMHMGEIDLGDKLNITLQHFFKAKRYYFCIFAHLLDLCVCNAWLLAHRDAKLLHMQYKTSLKKLRQEISTSFFLKDRVPKRGIHLLKTMQQPVRSISQ